MSDTPSTEVTLNGAQVLAVIDGGEALTRLDEMIQELVDAIKRTHEKGQITIRIDIEPDAIKDGEVVRFKIGVGKMEVKKPEPPIGDSYLYPAANGGLVKDDPRQPYIPTMEPGAVKAPVDRQSAKEA